MKGQIAAFVSGLLLCSSASLAWPGGETTKEPGSTPVQLIGESSEAKPTKPLSEGAASVTPQSTEAHSELVLRVGNESNQNDGAFGPLTFGLRGGHSYNNGMAVEAGYIRLHEPGSAVLDSFLDEAQISFKLPQAMILRQPLLFGATAWKNRMIDMYTNVGGIELTRRGRISVNLGLYGGSATREDASGNFFGMTLGLSGTLGPADFEIIHMNGRIDSGFYRRTALEGAINLSAVQTLPMTLTISVEDRFFDFGKSRPRSDPSDEYIVVTGIDFHFEDLFFP